MKLTYEDKVKIAKDYKKLVSNLTAKKWQISRRHVVTLANKYKKQQLKAQIILELRPKYPLKILLDEA